MSRMPTVARSAGFRYFNGQVPGVPLRSTPGFMLTPASRVEKRVARLLLFSIFHVLPNVRAGAVHVGEAIHSCQFTGAD